MTRKKATPTVKRPRSRQHWGRYTTLAPEKKVEAMKAFKSSPFYEAVMAFLEESSFAGQSPFDAAGYDPYKAAAISGRQDLLVMLEIEIKNAELWKPKAK